MEIPFKNTSLFYTSRGAGEPVVLIHGFLESSKIWKSFLPEFAKIGKVITLDLPGHGRSGCIGEVHSMELMAEALLTVLKALDIEKTNIVGHSMGGYAALAFLEKYPGMVSNLMLLNSTPAADSLERKKTRDRSMVVVKKNKEAFISMAISNLLSPGNTKKYETEVRELKVEALKFPTRGILNNIKGMKIRTDRTAVLEKFSGGKLIVSGKADPLINLHQIQRLAKVTGSFLISLPGGHLSYLENREKFIKLCISSNK